MPHPHQAEPGTGTSQSLFGFDPQSFLRDVPEATFQSFAQDDPFGKGPNQRRQFSNAFQDFQNRFLGESGSRAREGQAPRTFLDFLNNRIRCLVRQRRSSGGSPRPSVATSANSSIHGPGS